MQDRQHMYFPFRFMDLVYQPIAVDKAFPNRRVVEFGYYAPSGRLVNQ